MNIWQCVKEVVSVVMCMNLSDRIRIGKVDSFLMECILQLVWSLDCFCLLGLLFVWCVIDVCLLCVVKVIECFLYGQNLLKF